MIDNPNVITLRINLVCCIVFLIILDELPGDISLLLTNALWFKDSWNQPFDEVLEE